MASGAEPYLHAASIPARPALAGSVSREFGDWRARAPGRPRSPQVGFRPMVERSAWIYGVRSPARRERADNIESLRDRSCLAQA